MFRYNSLFVVVFASPTSAGHGAGHGDDHGDGHGDGHRRKRASQDDSYHDGHDDGHHDNHGDDHGESNYGWQLPMYLKPSGAILSEVAKIIHFHFCDRRQSKKCR